MRLRGLLTEECEELEINSSLSAGQWKMLFIVSYNVLVASNHGIDLRRDRGAGQYPASTLH